MVGHVACVLKKIKIMTKTHVQALEMHIYPAALHSVRSGVGNVNGVDGADNVDGVDGMNNLLMQ